MTSSRLIQIIFSAFAIGIIFSSQISLGQSGLTDIQDTPYQQSIEYFYEKGIVTGHPDLTFKPDHVLNKAEFLTLLLRSYSNDPIEEMEGCFLDVLTGEWYTKYICFAEEIGVARGNPDNTFSPEKPVNAAEAFALMFRLYGYDVDDSTEGLWYEKYIQFAKENNMLDDSDYDPSDLIQRDEGAYLTHQVYLDKNDVIPLGTGKVSFGQGLSNQAQTNNQANQQAIEKDLMKELEEGQNQQENSEEDQAVEESVQQSANFYLMGTLSSTSFSSGGGGGGGGGGGSSSSSNPPVPAPEPDMPTAQELAIETIVAYAEDGLTAPVLQDYTDAGVTGVEVGNLDQANAAIEALTGEDVDTLLEIQAVIDDLNTPPVPTAQELAIETIVAYAEDGLTAPVLQDYTDAGVTGVEVGNLDQANAAIEALTGEDVDTLLEIQAVIDGLNIAPVAIAQGISVDEDTVANVITLAGSDDDGDELTYTVVTQPNNGVLAGVAPNLTYTPDADYFGEDSFTFTVNDGTVDSEAATVSITINDVLEPVLNDTVLMFVAYNGTWWPEFKVSYEALIASGYDVEVRSSSPGVTLTYGDMVDNTTNDGLVAPSDYNDFTTVFEDSFGTAWDSDWNDLEDITLDGQIQDVENMDDYVALVIPGGYGSQYYRYDGAYEDLAPSAELLALGHHTIPNPELHVESAANVQSAAEALNDLIAEAVSVGKPVMTICHAAPLSAFARVPESVGGFDGLGVSLLDGHYATGFPLAVDVGGAVGDVADVYDDLNVTFLSNEAVVIDGPDVAFDGNGTDSLVTVLNWYPEHVAYGARSFINILETNPTLVEREQSIDILVFGGNEPSHYPGYTPANEVDLTNLLNQPGDYDINATATDDEAVVVATLENYDALLYFQHNEIAVSTQNFIRDYIDDGGAAVFIHHGIYNRNGGNDILVNMVGGQLPEDATLADTDLYFDEAVTNNMVNVNYGHFVSTFNVFLNDVIATPSDPVTVSYQSFDDHYPNRNLDGNGGYFSFQIPAPDELYAAGEFMPGVVFGRGVNEINRLFSSNTVTGNGLAYDGQYDTWGWTKLFNQNDPETVGKIVYLQPGETNDITFSTPAYQQVIRNAVVWAVAE